MAEPSVLQKKTEIFLERDIYPLLKNFPASEKFSLCQEIKQSCYKLIRAAVMANNLTNVNRRLMWLDEADAEKTLLLVLLGVAKNQKYITQKKLLELQGKLEEIGRIIGGLQKFFINNRKYRCGTPHLYEEGIKRLFLRAVADLTEDREVLLETCRMIHDEYLNTDTIDAECATLNDEIEIVSGLTKKLIAENATTAIPQDEYNRKYDALVERYHAAQDRLDELQKLRITRSFQADVLECFMFEIKAIDTSLPLEYTDRFWLNLIDRVTVYEDSRLVFRFKNGAKVEETL